MRHLKPQTLALVVATAIITGVAYTILPKGRESEKMDPVALAARRDFAAQQSRQDRQNGVEYIKTMYRLLIGGATFLTTVLVGLKTVIGIHLDSPKLMGCLGFTVTSIILGIISAFLMYNAKQEFGSRWEFWLFEILPGMQDMYLKRAVRIQFWGIGCLIAGFVAFAFAAGLAIAFAAEPSMSPTTLQHNEFYQILRISTGSWSSGRIDYLPSRN